MNASSSVRIALAAGAIVMSGCGTTALPASSLPSAQSPVAQTAGMWQLFADTDYPQGIVLAKNGDMWVGNGSLSTTLTRYTPAGKSTMFDVGLSPGELAFDGKGDIWFNVAGGVEYQIVRVTPQMQVTHYTLSDNAYSGITLGADGNIWFVEADHIGKITPDGKLTEYPSSENGGYAGIIWGTDNRVWFGTSQSLASLDPKNGKITTYAAPYCDCGGDFASTADGTVWYMDDGQLVRYDPKTNASSTYPEPRRLHPYGAPGDLKLAPDGKSIWYGAQRIANGRVAGGGFARFDLGTKKFTAFPAPAGYGWFWDVAFDKRGRVWATADPNVAVLTPPQ